MLQREQGWETLPYQWAAAGYMGAISSGHTICGALFGATVFLGALHDSGAATAPDVNDPRRLAAIEAVEDLFRGFIARFGATDCLALTGCDLSSEEARAQIDFEQVFQQKCSHYIQYALGASLAQARALGPSACSSGQP